MEKITYLKGDATSPIGVDVKLIVHCCNNIGAWGGGFTGALSKKWETPEMMYRNKSSYTIGEIDFIMVENDTYVINLIGQNGIRSFTNPSPINYDGIRMGLSNVADLISIYQKVYSVHMPRIGCGLAGGTWDKIEPIILEELSNKDVRVFVYDF